DPADYGRVLAALGDDGALRGLRRELALKVFQITGRYDTAIAAYLESVRDEPDLGEVAGLPRTYRAEATLAQSMRYGENPHQQAALYGQFHDCFEQLQGKELSYNNILDITAATYLIG